MDKNALERNRMRFERERKLQESHDDLLKALKWTIQQCDAQRQNQNGVTCNYCGVVQWHSHLDDCNYLAAEIAIAKAEGREE